MPSWTLSRGAERTNGAAFSVSAADLTEREDVMAWCGRIGARPDRNFHKEQNANVLQ